MTQRRIPQVFRITAAILIAAMVVGWWWQRQPVGPAGSAFLQAVANACPAASLPSGTAATVADTAHALDRWFYASIGNYIVRDGVDRCTRERSSIPPRRPRKQREASRAVRERRSLDPK